MRAPKPEPIPLREAKRIAVEGPTGLRARFEEWLRQFHPGGASRRQVLEARIFPVDTTDTHLNALRTQGRIVRLNGLWHRCGGQGPPKESEMAMAPGQQKLKTRRQLVWVGANEPVTLAAMRESGVWDSGRSVDNAQRNWQRVGWLKRAGDKYSLTAAGRARAGLSTPTQAAAETRSEAAGHARVVSTSTHPVKGAISVRPDGTIECATIEQAIELSQRLRERGGK